MTNIIHWPLYNMTNVPEALRKLAMEIERGDIPGHHCLIALSDDEGDVNYRAFGAEPFNRGEAVGLLFAVMQMILPASEK